MEQFIEKDLETIETLAALRSENLVEYTLDAELENVENKKVVIDKLLDSGKCKADSLAAVMDFIASYIFALLKGRMLVNNYVEKSKSKQDVFLFLHTHWAVVEMQLFYVFVKRCARKMGLQDFYCDDPDFMNKLYLRLIFKLMDYKKQKVMPGDVWVNVMNGTLEIHKDGSIELRPHSADDFFTYVLPYCYSPDAECPLWHKFLDRVMPDVEMQSLLAEFIGYCFTKNLRLEKQGIFFGTGANGKSVTLDIISKLLGSSNVSNVSLSSLTMDDEKRSLIEGKLANISTESGGQLDTAMLKQLISGEPTEVRKLYVGTHTMYDIPKLFTSYNRLPSAEYTFGFFRRWILFPFKVTIPEAEQDVDLVKKLAKELSGILNWVLASLGGLIQRKAFSKSDVCDKALKDYMNTSNSAMQFVAAMCEVDEGSSIKLSELYRRYTTYCVEEDYKKIGKKNFQEIIESFGAKVSMKQNFKFYNLAIRENADN